MEYRLDTNAAKQADNFFSRIEQKGRYLGLFTRAEKVISQKGTIGIDFSFKADSGETADYLTIWTHNKDGNRLQGFNTLMAIMTCLRVKELKATDGEIEKYDSQAKQRIKSVVPLFKELMVKPIGLLIHMEEYEKTSGGTAWKPSISAPFDKDGFTASEILNQAKTAGTLAKMEQALRDRPLKAGPSASQQPAASNYGGDGSFNDFESDIQF